MPYSANVSGALIVAPASRCRSMWLVSWNGSVLYVPGGTIRCPPPALAIAATALLKASVFIVLPSPTPPKSARLNFASGIVGKVAVISSGTAPPSKPASASIIMGILRIMVPRYQNSQSNMQSETQRTRILTFAALFGATLLSYFPALHDALLWDDDQHVTPRALQSLGGLWRIWSEPGATQQYYPLLHTAFWIEHRLWGDAVLGYHLVNVLLHATAGCLVVAIALH